ncbi:MAG: hypothetical protein QXI35_08215 [Candidatus Nezhaarchaeales archaeon]
MSVIVEGEDAYIVAYDLPSENHKAIVNTKAYAKVRAVRVNCTYKLRDLGIQCTESVILVSPSRSNDIDNVVKEVIESYNNLNKWLKDNGYIELPQPIIKKIKLTAEQKEDFKTLAEMRVKEKLDEIIEGLVDLINEIENIIDEERRRRLERNLEGRAKEAKRLEQLAKEIGLETNNKFDLVFQLYNSAIEKLKEGSI